MTDRRKITPAKITTWITVIALVGTTLGGGLTFMTRWIDDLSESEMKETQVLESLQKSIDDSIVRAARNENIDRFRESYSFNVIELKIARGEIAAIVEKVEYGLELTLEDELNLANLSKKVTEYENSVTENWNLLQEILTDQ